MAKRRSSSRRSLPLIHSGAATSATRAFLARQARAASPRTLTLARLPAPTHLRPAGRQPGRVQRGVFFLRRQRRRGKAWPARGPAFAHLRTCRQDTPTRAPVGFRSAYAPPGGLALSPARASPSRPRPSSRRGVFSGPQEADAPGEFFTGGRGGGGPADVTVDALVKAPRRAVVFARGCADRRGVAARMRGKAGDFWEFSFGGVWVWDASFLECG